MNEPFSFAQVSQQQRAIAKSVDDALHKLVTQTSLGLSPISMSLAFADWAMHLASSPGQSMCMAQHALALSQQALIFPGQSDPVAEAGCGSVPEMDSRFCDPGWRNWPFNAMKKSYKATEAWWSEATHVDGMSSHHHQIVRFITRQGLDALAPSNWALTNPEAFQKGVQTLGLSWLHGYQHYARDLVQYPSNGTDAGTLNPLPYKVGEDVAITPGKVVFRNHLIELIHYTPTTDKVYPEPILIVPSCIMKYYILDLSPSNSMVRYLVGKGHSVFMMSWRNPDASDRDLGMQDYLQMGVMEAMAAVKRLTRQPRLHALGYCLGGTFLAIVAAALCREQPLASGTDKGPVPRRRHEDLAHRNHLPELASVTLLAAQTEFSEPGELGVFIDDDQLKTLRETMARTGYLTGRQMAGSFQFLNSRDLIWARNTRRYLLGQDEPGNDMMSWNADVTRLPERMHSEYLSSLFLNNALASGHYRVGGVGVALKDINVPLLVVGTVRDHVSPWRSVYKIHLLTDTHTTFILAAGGHNAGIVSEPGHPHRSYQMDCMEPGHDWVEPDEWLANAPVVDGSWWEAMHAWLQARSGAQVSPYHPDPNEILGDAPGDYVRVRYAD